MDLFRLVDQEEEKKSRDTKEQVLETLSPLRKLSNDRNKRIVPDLCDTSDLSTESENVSREEDLSVNAKLERAKKRRETASKTLELILNDKNEQAFQRAQTNIETKREKYRKKNKNVERVNERHSFIQKTRCKHVMRNIENRLNEASTRAEQNIKKKQGIAARRTKRLEKVQNKRALLEFERRSAVLASLCDRTERATRNLQLRLEDLQGKAREEIERAHDVAKRVKAVRILQKLARAKLGLPNDQQQASSDQANFSSAALRLQNCDSWKSMVVANRLMHKEDIQNLKDLLSVMGKTNDGSSKLSFEELAAAISNKKSLKTADSLLSSWSPLLSKSANIIKPETLSARTLLSAFLVAMQPEEVLSDKRGEDKCSKLLEKAALTLIDALTELSNVKFSKMQQRQINNVIQNVCSKVLSYCTLFDKWKNADFEELVGKMKNSAHQSWIAYLTAKQALLYIEEKSHGNKNKHFRHLIKYKSSKKGASSHIKRIRAAMIRLVGEEESLALMKKEKETATLRIEKDQLMVHIKHDIDKALVSIAEESSHEDDSSFSLDANTNDLKGNMSKSVFSNSQLVHDLLLMDSEDLEDFSKLGFGNPSIYSNVEDFMEQFRSHPLNGEVDEALRLFSIQKLLIELIHKMRDLVPNRKDLHEYFTEDHIVGCESSYDYFCLTLNIANVMMNSLESEHRSEATLDWHIITSAWQNNHEAPIPYDFDCWKSYLEASLTFLIGKANLCQMDIANFHLLHAAPVIKANGKEYEVSQFQEKFGKLETYENMNNFKATRNWLKKLKWMNCTEDLHNQLKDLFVDDILFVTEKIAIPEVLDLDFRHIQQIREKARLSVISASLILHAYKVTNTKFSDVRSDSLPSEAKYWKKKLLEILNCHLPLEAKKKEASESIIKIAQIISGHSLVERNVATLENVTYSVLNGTDPVFLLLDKRMKCLFKDACKFVFNNDEDKVLSPLSMKTGRNQGFQKQNKKINPIKVQFNLVVRVMVTKLGFNFVDDDLLDATYQAYKVISHCLCLYGDALLCPMLQKLNKTRN